MTHCCCDCFIDEMEKKKDSRIKEIENKYKSKYLIYEAIPYNRNPFSLGDNIVFDTYFRGKSIGTEVGKELLDRAIAAHKHPDCIIKYTAELIKTIVEKPNFFKTIEKQRIREIEGEIKLNWMIGNVLTESPLAAETIEPEIKKEIKEDILSERDIRNCKIKNIEYEFKDFVKRRKKPLIMVKYMPRDKYDEMKKKIKEVKNVFKSIIRGDE